MDDLLCDMPEEMREVVESAGLKLAGLPWPGIYAAGTDMFEELTARFDAARAAGNDLDTRRMALAVVFCAMTRAREIKASGPRQAN